MVMGQDHHTAMACAGAACSSWSRQLSVWQEQQQHVDGGQILQSAACLLLLAVLSPAAALWLLMRTPAATNMQYSSAEVPICCSGQGI